MSDTTTAEAPVAHPAARPGMTWVWDVDAEEQREVSESEAAHGMLRYAKRLTPGSAERGELERQALAELERLGEWPPKALRKRKARAK